MKTALWIVIAAALLIGGFFALNAYIRHEELTGGPQEDAYEGWAEGTSEGYTFHYPETLDGEYYSASEWPPTLSHVMEYSCGESEFSSEQTRDGITYCKSLAAEGAAGSTYTTYEYRVGMHHLTFTVRFPQCMNYDEPNRSACAKEQDELDLDALALRILGSVR